MSPDDAWTYLCQRKRENTGWEHGSLPRLDFGAAFAPFFLTMFCKCTKDVILIFCGLRPMTSPTNRRLDGRD